MEVPHKFPKDSLGPVPPHSNPEPFSHDDAHLCNRSFPLTGQEVEEVGRNAAAVSLDPLDVPARSQKHTLTPRRLRDRKNSFRRPRLEPAL